LFYQEVPLCIGSDRVKHADCCVLKIGSAAAANPTASDAQT
jgi:hypothetical protein